MFVARNHDRGFMHKRNQPFSVIDKQDLREPHAQPFFASS